jgi:deoxyribonuclease-4
MLIGAHVSGGAHPTALDRGAAIGADAVQIFTQSPRTWRPAPLDAAALDSYRSAQDSQKVVRATFCHATYLINLAAPSADLLERSQQCLLENYKVAVGIGASGLILHVGSHRGAGLGASLPRVVVGLRRALAEVENSSGMDPCPILLENTAGAGGTIGRTFEELAEILEAVTEPDRTGVCIDTQHLWASGISYASRAEADEVIETIDGLIGLEKLRCFHLNDSKVPLAANRDRHENLGKGTIGGEALSWLVGHPRLQVDDMALLLEVPGDGYGPRKEDVEAARRIHRAGLERWAVSPRDPDSRRPGSRDARTPGRPDSRRPGLQETRKQGRPRSRAGKEG